MKKTYVKPECEVCDLIIKPQVICSSGSSSGSIQEDTNTPSEFGGELN